MLNRRGSGIILHISSLPSRFGIGDLGPGAYQFVDFLAASKESVWQILPLNPTDLANGNSPYDSPSAFAGNTLFISPELLQRDGLLDAEHLEPLPSFPADAVDYATVIAYKEKLFDDAYVRFKAAGSPDPEYEKFCAESSNWLEDFGLFVVMKAQWRGKSWSEWPEEVRNRNPEALSSLRQRFQERIEREKFLQHVFFRQWEALKRYGNHQGVQIVGDIPIYVGNDSADVWTHPELFKLDEEKRPAFVAAVPPDYFSETGQLWGNPVYRWDVLKEKGYPWWIERIEHNLKLFDFVRIDHFRGFVAYWEVPAGEKTAVNGRWVEGCAEDFFTTLLKRFPALPILAEDLGLITPDVREIMQRFEFPGMRLLLFAFGEDLPRNPYAPHNHVENCVVYTGTHDNNTVRGWLEKEATAEDRERLFRYLGRRITAEEAAGELIRLAMMSVARLVIFPMQDILRLGEEARMNRPATTEGNWRWRLLPEQLTPALSRSLLAMAEIYGRA